MVSAKPRAVGYFALGNCDNDSTVFLVETREEELRHHRANLLGREVDDADDLPSQKIIASVEIGDLRTRLPSSDVRAEVDGDPSRRASLLRESRPLP